MTSEQHFNTGDISGGNVNVGGTQNIYNYGAAPPPPEPPRNTRLFLSYARADDEPFVKQLYHHLTDHNFDVWWDRQSMPNRALTFSREIEQAIEWSDKLLLILGPAALTSRYVTAEWQHALKQCKPVIPLLRLGAYDSIPTALSGYHTPDCRAPRDETDMHTEIRRVATQATAPLGSIVNVPSLPTGYVVRKDDLPPLVDAITADAIQQTSVISSRQRVNILHGIGGVGKTVLAAALCRTCDVRFAFPDGVFWLNIGPHGNAITRLGDIIAHFGGDPTQYPDVDSARARVSALLADKSALLVLDDVWDHTTAQPFTAIGDKCRLLVTSRVSAIAGKLNAGEHPVDALTLHDARAVFAAHQPDPALTPGALPPQCDTMHRLLAGHTLAIALAAAKLADKGLPYAPKLLERLEKRRDGDNPFRDLTLHDTDKDFNLELCLSLSYDDLTPNQQRRYRAMGVLAPEADFGMALMQALWADDDPDDTEDELDKLRHLGLVDAEGERHTQHALLRSYARALLLRENDLDAAFTRYADHVIATAEQFDALPLEEWHTFTDDLPHVDYVGDELSRLWDAAADDDNALRDRILIFADKVSHYVFYRPQMVAAADGPRLRGLNWLQQGLGIAQQSGNKKAESRFVNRLGAIYKRTGNTEQSLKYHQRALALARELANTHDEAASLNNIGDIYRDLGRTSEALTSLEQSLALRQQIGDVKGEAVTLNNIGLTHNNLGDPQTALAYYQQSLPLRQQVGDIDGEATTLNNIGLAYNNLGNRESALSYYEQALPLYQQVGDRNGEANTINNIGLAYEGLGDDQRALTYYLRALPIMQEIGDKFKEAITCYNIGALYHRQGDLDRAIAYVERCVMLDELVQHPDLESDRTQLEYLKQLRTQQEAPQLPESNPVVDAIHTFLNTSSWTEARQVYEANEGLLASPQAEQILESSITQATDPQWQATLRNHLDRIRSVKAVGIDAAFSDAPPQSNPVMDAIRAFLGTSNWAEARQVYTANEAVLSSPQVEAIFEQNIAQGDDEQFKANLQAHLDRIRRAKAVGIDAAFSDAT